MFYCRSEKLAKFYFVSKSTNSKQPTREDTSFRGLLFTKSEGKQQVCYLKSNATSFYDNANKNSLNSDHAIEVSSAMSLRLRTPLRKVIPG